MGSVNISLYMIFINEIDLQMICQYFLKSVVKSRGLLTGLPLMGDPIGGGAQKKGMVSPPLRR
jgi:hypothetical protein